MTDRAGPQQPREKAHYEGHRARLRVRLLQAGADSLQDYELLEMLLFAVMPRRDVKPLAKHLLTECKGLWGVLTADVERLRALGLSENVIAFLRTVGIAGLRAHKSEIVHKPILNSWQRVVDYCRAAMAHETKEQFRLLFLDRRNRLIGEEIQQRGTVDHTPVYPREIVQRALEVGAGAIILAHNHPSGDVTPSRADIDMTKVIQAACHPLDIVIHDHIIIGIDNVASFKALGLL